VHEEKVDVGNCGILVVSRFVAVHWARTVANKESLVAGGHQVAGLPVRSVTDLSRTCQLVSIFVRLTRIPAQDRRCVSSKSRVVESVPWAWQPGP
jgi:hypothetical protein